MANRFSIIKYVILLLVAAWVLCGSRIFGTIDTLYWHTHVFRELGGDLGKIRIFNTGIDASEVKGLVPEGAQIVVKPKKERVIANPNEKGTISSVPEDIVYQLYPLKVSLYSSAFDTAATNIYLIDFTDSLYKNAPSITLKTGHRLIDTAHSGFSRHQVASTPSGYKIVLVFVMISLLYIIIGASFLKLWSFQPVNFLHLSAASYMTGMLITDFALAVLMLSGLKLTQTLVIITCLGLVFILTAVQRFNLKAIFKIQPMEGVNNLQTPKLFAFTCGAIITLVLVVVFINYIRPVDSGDAIAYWMLKAKMIFSERAFVFKNVAHTQDPVLMPMYVATSYAMLGSIADEFAMWSASAIYICVLCWIYAGVLYFTKDKLTSILMTLTYILFFLLFYIVTPTGDQMVMLFLTASAIQALRYILNNDKNDLALSFFFAIGLTLSKREGFIYAVFIGFSILFFTYSNLKNLKPVIIFISFSALTLLTLGWKIYMKKIGLFNGSTDFSTQPLTAFKIYKAFKAQIWLMADAGFQNGVVAGCILALGASYKKFKSIEPQFFILLIFLSSIFAFSALIPLPMEVIVHEAFAASPRLLLQSSPFLVILLGLMVYSVIIEPLSQRNAVTGSVGDNTSL